MGRWSTSSPHRVIAFRGAAILIASSQFKHFFGIDIPRGTSFAGPPGHAPAAGEINLRHVGGVVTLAPACW